MSRVRERLSDLSWVKGLDTVALSREMAQISEQLRNLARVYRRPRILVAERNPLRFLAVLFSSLTEEVDLFLGNPDWGKSEQREVLQMASPDLLVASGWSEGIVTVERGEGIPDLSDCLLMIPTGGSSGKVKFAMHSVESLSVAIEGLCGHFSIEKINSCCVLPLFHVSGLMQVFRGLLSNGSITLTSFENLEKKIFPEVNESSEFISLVPTQLNRLLAVESSVDWLRRFRAIFLGGGPAWPDLLHRARKAKLPLSLTYGMTESAAQVATLKPEKFLSGEESVGLALPHVDIFIEDEDPNTDIGLIWLKAKSLFFGYYPDFRKDPGLWKTDDLGLLDEKGCLTLMGRADEVINTGGEKVYPRDVEAIIRNIFDLSSIVVLGVVDAEWGEIVCAVYQTSDGEDISEDKMRQRLKGELSTYKVPKKWIRYPDALENKQGKINRDTVRYWLEDN